MIAVYITWFQTGILTIYSLSLIYMHGHCIRFAGRDGVVEQERVGVGRIGLRDKTRKSI